MDLSEARRAISQLHIDLQGIVAHDQEQEVQGLALPVIDAVLAGIRSLVPVDHPVLSCMQDLISPEAIYEGQTVRAVDALLVAGQLMAALPDPIPVPQSRPKWL